MERESMGSLFSHGVQVGRSGLRSSTGDTSPVFHLPGQRRLWEGTLVHIQGSELLRMGRYFWTWEGSSCLLSLLFIFHDTIVFLGCFASPLASLSGSRNHGKNCVKTAIIHFFVFVIIYASGVWVASYGFFTHSANTYNPHVLNHVSCWVLWIHRWIKYIIPAIQKFIVAREIIIIQRICDKYC